MNQPSAQQIRGVGAALADPAVRRQYRDAPKVAHQELLSLAGVGQEMPGDVEIKAVFNTADTTYIALPAIDTEHQVKEADLARLAAAGSTASTVASAGSIACLGSFCTTSSTASSAGSAGSVGCATE